MAIYFIQAGEGGPIKIGYAADVFRRMVKMQADNHCRLTILGVAPGERDTEQYLQAQFIHSRVRGEWFEPTPELLALAAGHVVIQTPPKRTLPAEHPTIQEIQRRLAETGISESALCRHAEISHTTWVRLKNGSSRGAHPRTIEKLRDALATLVPVGAA